jgi:hypothetical protein
LKTKVERPKSRNQIKISEVKTGSQKTKEMIKAKITLKNQSKNAV